MKFSINLSGKTLHTRLREAGYAPEGKTGELAFRRFFAGRAYPKFHLYCTLSEDKKFAILNLHLDQKRPSYAGSHAHNAEYDGPLVEQEAQRIQSLI